ncbi:related to Probable transcription factor TDA9 [Nakaseomyces glabratus]|nr:Zinc finger C2H2 type domain signature [Nakaseomyces glabratus]QNG14314.1 uncharacterized protein GWK60_H04015 [Nakaseomyces glabratus]SCV16096.1 related to Probable transcription factor TDA9 [Nakaseomyces glabratus]SLM15823.1 related to Probable transcription factor TDA9 [Nakaseomyces glabratus]
MMSVGSVPVDNGANFAPIPKKSRTIKTDKPRPHLCPICTRGFVRLEHLKRHQRAHTNEKPFLCVFCGRCFARRDLVLRHQYKLHPTLVSKNNEGSLDNSRNNSVSPGSDNSSDALKAEAAINDNIIKVSGNRATILPTPSNPLAKTTAELRKAAKVAESTGSSKESTPSTKYAKKVNKKRKTKNKEAGSNGNSSSTSPLVSPSIFPQPLNLNQKKDNNLSVPASRNKRHASFSASSAFTYFPDNVSLNGNDQEHQRENIEDLGEGIPHLVGFSTPQLSAQELIRKVMQTGTMDFEPLDLPPSLFGDENGQQMLGMQNGDSDFGVSLFNSNGVTKSNNERVDFINGKKKANTVDNTSTTNYIGDLPSSSMNNSNMKHANSSASLAAALSSMFAIPNQSSTNLANSGPSHQILTDLVTMGSSFGGSNGFNKNLHNNTSELDLFNYKNWKNNSYHDIFEAPSASKQKKRATFTTNDVTEIDDQIDGQNFKSPQSIPDSNQRGNTNTTSPDEDWTTKFIKDSDLEKYFDMDADHFNDIGFFHSNINDANQNSIKSNLPSGIASSQNSSNETSAINSSSNLPRLGNSVASPINSLSNKSAVNTPPVNIEQPSVNKVKNVEFKEFRELFNSHIDNYGLPNHMSKRTFEEEDIGAALERSVSSLFTSRQVELFRKNVNAANLSLFSNPSSASSSLNGSPRNSSEPLQKKQKHIPPPLAFFTEKFREQIVTMNNLTQTMFPSVNVLNHYVNLYQKEFHPYFSFIHLPSFVPSTENYPFLLSVAMIGALYAFHSNHAMILCKVARHNIRVYLEQTVKNQKVTPLWLIQSLVLLTFVGIFSDDLNVARSMNTQLMTLIRLIKKTNLNMPLENYCKPPIASNHALDYQNNPATFAKYKAQYTTPEQLEKDFQYFILAQTRIRTCHVVLIISNLFTSLVGLECCFHSIDLNCGVPCYHESLFSCPSSNEWAGKLEKYNIVLDSKFSLIELSNGEAKYANCMMYLSNGSQYVYDNTKVSKKTLLSLLITIHEKIFIERNNIRHENGDNIPLNDAKWRMSSRPMISVMVKHWESMYIKNGGLLVPTDENIKIINRDPAMRLIVPLHSFALIRKCLDLTPVMKQIYMHNWVGMNETMQLICCDWESLRESTTYALNIIDFWVITMDGLRNQSIGGTPIFTITCIFSAVLIVAEYMKHLEDWSNDVSSDINSQPNLKVSDRILWFKIFKVLKKVEGHLSSRDVGSETYSQFLRTQANGALDIGSLDEAYIESATKPDREISETLEVIKNSRLSTRSLYFGVRILGDAPVWPIAILFALALQCRAIHMEKSADKTLLH